jgi:hypothetical protein
MHPAKKILAIALLFAPVVSFTQNVGIGTATPEVRLHVAGGNLWVDNPLNTNSVVYLRSGSQNGLLIEANSTGSATFGRLRPIQGGGASAGLTIRQNNYVGIGLTGQPQYPLHIHATSDALSTSGIAFTHTSLGDDPNNGMKVGLQVLPDDILKYGFIQWPGFMPFNFFQGNVARLSIDALGKISIGTAAAEARLHVRDDANGASAMIVENRQIGGGVPKGLSVIVRDGLGVGIDARAENLDGTASAVELGASAIRASAGNNRNAIMANASNGVAVRARATSSDGFALQTDGKIRFQGNGSPQAGRVLTANLEGNAVWQDLPATPIPNAIVNGSYNLGINSSGNATLIGGNFLIRAGIPAPAPVNPIGSDGLYFYYSANKGALRSGQFIFDQLRNDSIGLYSLAMGQRVIAKGEHSVAIGLDNHTDEDQAQAYGTGLRTSDYREIVLGSYNVGTGSFGLPTWIAESRIMTVGNGQGANTRSNAMVILKNGNTGIGVNEPVAPLHVNSRLVIERPTGGSANTAALEWRSNGAYRGGMGWDPNAGRFFFYDGESNTNTLFINNGRIGIQRNPTTNAFEVNGNASKNSAGDWLANSDARLKSGMQPLEGALNKITRLQGITYQWNDNQTGMERPVGEHMGFTAQNIQEVFPQLVVPDAQGFLQTAYGTYDALYVEAIKELLKKIEVLEARVKYLERINQ